MISREMEMLKESLKTCLVELLMKEKTKVGNIESIRISERI